MKKVANIIFLPPSVGDQHLKLSYYIEPHRCSKILNTIKLIVSTSVCGFPNVAIHETDSCGFDLFFASLTPKIECTIKAVPIIDVANACGIDTPSRG